MHWTSPASPMPVKMNNPPRYTSRSLNSSTAQPAMVRATACAQSTGLVSNDKRVFMQGLLQVDGSARAHWHSHCYGIDPDRVEPGLVCGAHPTTDQDTRQRIRAHCSKKRPLPPPGTRTGVRWCVRRTEDCPAMALRTNVSCEDPGCPGTAGPGLCALPGWRGHSHTHEPRRPSSMA